jgi:hypothetical protein
MLLAQKFSTLPSGEYGEAFNAERYAYGTLYRWAVTTTRGLTADSGLADTPEAADRAARAALERFMGSVAYRSQVY